MDEQQEHRPEVAARVEALQLKHGKAGAVEFSGHVIYFRKPSRQEVREYRRQKDSDAEKMDAIDHLAQKVIAGFDEQEDPNLARTTFTNVFLESYPMVTSHPKFVTTLSWLSGLLEEEEAKDLGKGVWIRSARPPSSPKVSPNGSAVLSTSEK